MLRFVKTDKPKYGNLFYPIDITIRDENFYSEWRCLLCGTHETMGEGYSTADEAVAIAKDRIAFHHRLKHPDRCAGPRLSLPELHISQVTAE